MCPDKNRSKGAYVMHKVTDVLLETSVLENEGECMAAFWKMCIDDRVRIQQNPKQSYFGTWKFDYSLRVRWRNHCAQWFAVDTGVRCAQVSSNQPTIRWNLAEKFIGNVFTDS